MVLLFCSLRLILLIQVNSVHLFQVTYDRWFLRFVYSRRQPHLYRLWTQLACLLPEQRLIVLLGRIQVHDTIWTGIEAVFLEQVAEAMTLVVLDPLMPHSDWLTQVCRLLLGDRLGLLRVDFAREVWESGR